MALLSQREHVGRSFVQRTLDLAQAWQQSRTLGPPLAVRTGAAGRLLVELVAAVAEAESFVLARVLMANINHAACAPLVAFLLLNCTHSSDGLHSLVSMMPVSGSSTITAKITRCRGPHRLSGFALSAVDGLVSLAARLRPNHRSCCYMVPGIVQQIDSLVWPTPFRLSSRRWLRTGR